MRKSGKSDQRGFVYVAILILTCTLCLIAVAFLTRVGLGTSTVMARSNAIQAGTWPNRRSTRDLAPDEPKDFRRSNRYYMPGRPDDTATWCGDGRRAAGSIAATGRRRLVVMSYVIAFLPPTQMVTKPPAAARHRAITGVFPPDLVIVKSEPTPSASSAPPWPEPEQAMTGHGADRRVWSA
jgi:hypothetical protein